MKKIIYSVASSTLLLLPLISSAQAPGTGLAQQNGGAGGVETIIINLLSFTNRVLIPFVIGIGFLFFVWGVFLYFIKGGADDESQTKGKNLMVYATLGFVLIVVFWGIINLLVGTLGLTNTNIPNIPNVPGTRGAPLPTP